MFYGGLLFFYQSSTDVFSVSRLYFFMEEQFIEFHGVLLGFAEFEFLMLSLTTHSSVQNISFLVCLGI